MTALLVPDKLFLIDTPIALTESPNLVKDVRNFMEQQGLQVGTPIAVTCNEGKNFYTGLITEWCITYDSHTMTSEIVLKFQAFPKYELCILTVGSIELSFRVK